MPTRSHSLYFKAEKPIVCAIHPTLPWLVACMKHDYILVLHNFEEDLEIARFYLLNKLEERREEAEQQKALNGDLSPASPAIAKLGEVRGLWFYDNDVIANTILTHTSRALGASGKAESTSIPLTSCNIAGRWLIVCCELRVVMLMLDTSTQYVDVTALQLDNKSIMTMTPLYQEPWFAIGCSDGNLRLWNYETNTICSAKLPFPGGKPLAKLLVIHSMDSQGHTVMNVVGANEAGTIASFGSSGATNAAVNASKNTFTLGWNVVKVHDSAVVDMVYDSVSGELTSLSNSGFIIQMDSVSGKVLKKLKATRKNFSPKSLLLARTERGTCTTSYLLPTKFTKVFSINRFLTEKSLLELAEFSSTKKGVDIKIYSAAVHPTLPNLVFCCTNAGCFSFTLASDWEMPTVTMAYATGAMNDITRTLLYIEPRKEGVKQELANLLYSVRTG